MKPIRCVIYGQDLTVDMNLASGFINNVTLRRTIPLKQGDRFFDGLNALYVLDNGTQSSIVADGLKTMVIAVVVAIMTTTMGLMMVMVVIEVVVVMVGCRQPAEQQPQRAGPEPRLGGHRHDPQRSVTPALIPSQPTLLVWTCFDTLASPSRNVHDSNGALTACLTP